MLHMLTGFSDGGDFFNLFRYITFRASGALVTALLFGFLFGRPLIELLRRRQRNGQPIREDGPESHRTTKAGTPTMGGVLILGALLVSTLLWARLDNVYIWIVLMVTLGFGAIGMVDDSRKVSSNSTKGISARIRFAGGLVIAAAAGFAAQLFHPEQLSGALAFPFLKDFLLDLGLLYVVFCMLVIVGSANAVNLTDGLDGLAIMPVMISAATLGIIAYAVGRVDFTNYLDVHYVPGTGELLVFSAGLIGGGLGFPLVQCAPGGCVHGRHGITRAWRRGWRDCRSDQARTGASDRRWAVRGRGAQRDHPSVVLQGDQEEGVPHGTHPPPLRKAGLGRGPDCHQVLDNCPDSCADRTCHPQGEVSRIAESR